MTEPRYLCAYCSRWVRRLYFSSLTRAEMCQSCETETIEAGANE